MMECGFWALPPGNSAEGLGCKSPEGIEPPPPPKNIYDYKYPLKSPIFTAFALHFQAFLRIHWMTGLALCTQYPET